MAHDDKAEKGEFCRKTGERLIRSVKKLIKHNLLCETKRAYSRWRDNKGTLYQVCMSRLKFHSSTFHFRAAVASSGTCT